MKTKDSIPTALTSDLQINKIKNLIETATRNGEFYITVNFELKEGIVKWLKANGFLITHSSHPIGTTEISW
jgi:hypothetical protein